MPVLTGTNLALSFGEREILKGISLSLEPKEKIGMVGRNGSGKSTLLKVLAGMIPHDAGSVVIQQGIRAGYLHQQHNLVPEDTLHEAAGRAFEMVEELHEHLERVYHDLGEASGDQLDRLLKEQERLERAIEAAGGYTNSHKIDQVLHGLGFTDAQFEIKVKDLSGGQCARVALAKLLLENPSILLLDEPTNHLDVAGREWLEDFLRDEYNGAVILISHDRYLLDRVVTRIVEVEDGKLVDYPGNYAAFRKQRIERRMTMLRAYEKQQAVFKKEEAYIRQYKAGQRAKQAKGRESKLDRDKLSAIERPVELDDMRMNLPKADRSGDIVIAARDISKKYKNHDGTDKVLFTDLSLHIERGQRWGIIGPNGAGKTTLIRSLLGEQSVDQGTIKLGSKLAVGHFTQTHDDLDPEKTVYRHIQDTIKKETEERVLMSEQDARNLAGAFLFSGRDQEKPLGVMSGGEQARAVLAALLASAKNVLVLDEPTNHLDIQAAERLESAIARTYENPKTGEKTTGEYDGTVLLISHDRALIDAVCDHIMVLDGEGNTEIFSGTYSEWKLTKESRRESSTRTPRPNPESSDQAAPKQSSQTPSPQIATQGSQVTKNKFSWMPIAKIEERMTELEIEIKRIEAKLGDADVWIDYEKANSLTEKLDECKEELSELELEWLNKSS
ncbi:MAG: ABC-F family ATP-binding cassette domain-containing protein [Phycisphaerales bacterium]|nr:ABC-F family ATP-binding cassette domain-containing protein [Phycisphaerales bacterium]